MSSPINPEGAIPDRATVELEAGEKKAFCRCWKSKNMPYCDGSHRTHNKETGDNLGPVIVSYTPATEKSQL